MGFLNWKEEFRVPGPAGIAAPKTVNKTEDGITDCYGATVPTDATAGYAPGCKFTHVDGTTGTAVYFNEGTATSCDFNAVVTGENTMVTVATGLNMNPDAAFGKVYWVDENTGDDDNDGLTPGAAFATIGYAIGISNAEVGDYNMNTIYVNAQTYTEDLTAEPYNVNIIGIGGKTRLQGNHVFDTGGNASQNCHWYNMQFRATTGVLFTITSNTYGYGWHGCTFEGSGTVTGALQIALGHDTVIENCRFLGNPVFTTAIQITGHQLRSVIRNNIIAATTNGILLDTTSAGYGSLIEGNVIGRSQTDPNSSAQMAYGIKSEKADGHSGFMMVNNRIEAVDGIYFAHTSGTTETDICLGNICSQAGTGSNEVLLPAT